MKQKIINFILKIKRKVDQLECQNYFESLKEQCEMGENVTLYKNCFIYDGHPNYEEGGDKNIKIGNDSHIKGELQTLGHGGKIVIGNYSYIGPNTYMWSGKSISIGNRVLIGPGCCIFDNDIHPLDPEIRHRQFMDIVTTGQPKWITLNDREVEIKDDAWIGCNVIILKGVTIGKGAIVGAGSVVTHDIPDYAIAHGNPAKVSRLSQNGNEDYK